MMNSAGLSIGYPESIRLHGLLYPGRYYITFGSLPIAAELSFWFDLQNFGIPYGSFVDLGLLWFISDQFFWQNTFGWQDVTGNLYVVARGNHWLAADENDVGNVGYFELGIGVDIQFFRFDVFSILNAWAEMGFAVGDFHTYKEDGSLFFRLGLGVVALTNSLQGSRTVYADPTFSAAIDDIDNDGRIAQGETATLRIIVENRGEATVRNIVLSILGNNSESKRFLPEDSAEIRIGNVYAEGRIEKVLPLNNIEDPQTSDLSFTVAVRDGDGWSSSQTLSFASISEDDLKMALVEETQLPPYLVPSVVTDPPSGVVRAGDPLTLSIEIKNVGKGNAYQLKGTVESQSALLNGAELIYGSIEPGKNAVESVKIEPSHLSTDEELQFRVVFSEANRYEPEPVSGSVLVRGLPRPQYTYSYQVLDDNSGNSVGNGDGKVQRGEALDLLITVKNVGNGIGRNVVTLVRPERRLTGLVLSIPESSIGSIQPEDQASTRLTVSLQKSFESRLLRLQLHLVDSYWEIATQDPIVIPLEEEVIARPMQIRREIVTIYDQVTIRGGASTQTPILAQVGKEARLLAVAQLGDWYKVKVSDDLSGWVLASDVALGDRLAERQEVQTATASVIRVFQKNPPIVAIFDPDTETFETPLPTIPIAGIATDDNGISSVVISINGKLIASGGQRGIGATGTGRTEMRFEHEVQLVDGVNRISVEAIDVDGMRSAKNLVVTRTVAMPEVWAAVVGISDYQTVADLRYATNDADAMARYLTSDLGIPADHVFVLKDQDATSANIKQLWGETIRATASKEDQVLFYFSGHGAVEEDTSSPDGDGLGKYLLAADSRVDALYSTAIPMDEVARIFSRLASERIVFIADTCYSGASGGRTVFTGNRKAVLNDDFLERLASGKGRVIITASGANEVSRERSDLRHGIFTYHLLQALKGKGDADGDGYITEGEAFEYVSDVVPEATGQLQHPVRKGETESPIILGRVR